MVTCGPTKTNFKCRRYQIQGNWTHVKYGRHPSSIYVEIDLLSWIQLSERKDPLPIYINVTMSTLASVQEVRRAHAKHISL